MTDERPEQAQPGLAQLLLRIEEAGDLLGVGAPRIHELIGSGALQSV